MKEKREVEFDDGLREVHECDGAEVREVWGGWGRRREEVRGEEGERGIGLDTSRAWCRI